MLLGCLLQHRQNDRVNIVVCICWVCLLIPVYFILRSQWFIECNLAEPYP
uniref:Uncharacterized protein n=1 Tax=Arundo donax TaxID=35708 RepID=A0A0A8YLI6_ARUDO